MLTIFDIDGTLCDSRDAEGTCYAKAIEHITGKSLTSLDWTTYSEPTSSGIVQALLQGDNLAREKERQIEIEYVRLLKEARNAYPEEFTPISGAVEFLHRLHEQKVSQVAIATGCFIEEARFKLECCGIDIDDYPHATSSDTPRRRDIIPLVASRAGFDTSSVIYFGDAPWDVDVSRILKIPMVGIGRRIQTLRGLGASVAFPDYTEPDVIISVIKEIKERSLTYALQPVQDLTDG
jgi:phosphoglycolate phosphatase-like HAD superfamily hydrolase